MESLVNDKIQPPANLYVAGLWGYIYILRVEGHASMDMLSSPDQGGDIRCFVHSMMCVLLCSIISRTYNLH